MMCMLILFKDYSGLFHIFSQFTTIMHQYFAVRDIIGMEISDFEVIGCFGDGKTFFLYRFYCNRCSVRKQEGKPDFQLFGADKFVEFLYIERMPACADHLLAVGVDMLSSYCGIT